MTSGHAVSALLDSTVDTCCQSTSSLVLGSCDRLSSCSPCRESCLCPLYLAVTCSVFAVMSAGKLVLRCRSRVPWAGFAGVDALCAMFPSFVLRPRCLHLGRYGREGQSRGASLSWCRGRFPWSSLFRKIIEFPLLLNKPLVSGICTYLVFACGVQDYGFSVRFQECSAFSSPWFDSGFVFGVRLRGFLDEFHTCST